MGWTETRDALRREVERGNTEWQRARARHAALAGLVTTSDLTSRLVDAGAADWNGRRAIAQALLLAHREAPSSCLSSALVLAFWPLLSNLCGRVRSSLDREQIALTSFVLAIAECDPARGVDSLAWRTRRHFFRALRAEESPRFDELSDVEDAGASAEDAVVLRDALRTIEERHGVAVLASLGDEPLTHLAARMDPNARPRARERAAFALYKRRQRALASLRDELQQISA
jgi:hypothetical protein